MNHSGITSIIANQHLKEKNYWLGKFKSDFTKVNIPYDMEYSNKRIIETMDTKIEGQIYESIQKICSGSHIKTFIVFAAVIKVLLYKYTGIHDITVGTSILKQEEEREFINTVLALRSELDVEGSFRNLLEQVRRTIAEALEHQNYPINSLIYQLGLEGEYEENCPLFDIELVCENIQKKEYMNELKTNFRITFKDNRKYINVELNYNSNLYEEETIHQLIHHMHNIWKEIMSNLDISLEAIKITDDNEDYKLMEVFNKIDVKADTLEQTIYDLFHEAAVKMPESAAVQFRDEIITYAMLDEKACKAAKLIKKYVEVENEIRMVGVFTYRGINMIAALLGILKAGMAYIPIDPEYPADRIQYILDDSNINLVLTGVELPEDVVYRGTTVALDDINSMILENSEEDSRSIDDVAYMIYTSGSSGKPKGVYVKQKSIVNTLLWRRKYYGFSSRDVVLQIPTYTFDSSVEDIFTPLISGAKLLLLEQENRFNADYLLNLITQNDVTHFLITPALYKVLLDEMTTGVQGKGLRIITVAGDNFSTELIHTHFEKLADVRLINEYGPTENSVCSTVYEFSQKNGKILIGKPIDNVLCYVLDESNHICPIGVYGELCLAGKGLAQGYWNNDELTNDKFIPCPFRKDEKMYRTGDLARWKADGNLEFAGRKDFQVKIRGFRIELGEIEQALLRLDFIKDTAVLAKDDKDGNKYLVQYFSADKKYVIAEIRKKLSTVLPGYMVPTYFIQLDKLPLTNNGKINRNALLKIQEEDYLTEEYKEASTETEKVLATMWSEILGIEKVGVYSNFFEIGGHSLRASTLILKIRKYFNINMPFNLIFERPTIYQLSEYIDSCDKVDFKPIVPAAKQNFYLASAAQNRIYLVNKLDGISVTYNVPLKMTVDGIIEREQCEKVLGILLERHEALRTSFEYRKEGLVQVIHEDINFCMDYKMIDSNELKKTEKEFVYEFDLNKAPLFRAMLIHTNDNKSILLFDMHHIISDGISMNILVREFTQLYEGRTLNNSGLQYKDFSVWHEDYLKSEAVEKQVSYWQDVFASEPVPLNMPTDLPRPHKNSFRGDKFRTIINTEMTEALTSLANQTGTTLYIVLLSAYNILLSKYTGQDDIVIGSPVAGRTNEDICDVVGVFINMIALRTYPDGNKEYINYLEEVKEAAIGAFTNQDCQFNDVVKRLNVERSSDRKPLFDIMFALQNTEFDKEVIQGKRFEITDIDVPISKFDLSLIAVEREYGTELIFEYCTDLFLESTIERMADHFITILEQIILIQTAKLSNISMISEAEKNQILTGFNNTALIFDQTKSVVNLFEEQVKLTPQDTAVVCEGIKYSYEKLNRLSNQTANMLRERFRINPNNIVGIYADASFEMIVGILGVLKAGGAYLPIDTKSPKERILYMLEEAEVKLLLYYGSHLNLEGFSVPAQQITIEESDTYSSDNLNISINLESLAYVIYTSGSTGKPKGVMIWHKALLNLCHWHNTCFNVTAKDRATKYANVGFDASVWEIFPYMIKGASIYIIDEAMRYDVVKLNRFYNDNEITISFLPTQVCAQFLDLNNQSLRYLLTGGDKLNYYTEQSYQLVNNYGPTEYTVVATSHVIKQDSFNIPIGKPIANTEILILDKNNKLQPVGIPGEICISGESLAAGYIKSSELTAMKFKEHPFTNEKRLYYTGDLGKWTEDGNIQFLGRMDQQVKIRGNRVELGEIEYQLLKYEEIKEAIVLLTGHGENKRLIAYYTADEKQDPEVLKRMLEEHLPGYMIPAGYIYVEGIPLTKNNKVDKKALLEIKEEKIEIIVKPSTETELQLMEIWKEVLEADSIGNRDNFFDIGGTSLLIMKVVNMIYQKFNIGEEELSVMAMFEYPTIETMAGYLDGILGAETNVFEQVSQRIKKRKIHY